MSRTVPIRKTKGEGICNTDMSFKHQRQPFAGWGGTLGMPRAVTIFSRDEFLFDHRESGYGGCHGERMQAR